jgi:hypothetical protein
MPELSSLVRLGDIWTLLALGVTALFSVVLSVRGLLGYLPWGTGAQAQQGARA